MTYRSTGASAALVCALLLLLAAPEARAQTSTAPDASLPVILAVGESTTAGFGVDRTLSYPAQLQKALDERGYRYRVVNHGVSGSTTGAALTRLDRGVSLYPKIVIIALGGNDGGSRVSVGETRQNLSKMVSMFRRIGAQVLLADRALQGDGAQGPTLFAQLAEEHGAVLMPPLLTDVAGHPELLISDGRHPNADGYAIVVRNLMKILEPHLSRPADHAGHDGR